MIPIPNKPESSPAVTSPDRWGTAGLPLPTAMLNLPGLVRIKPGVLGRLGVYLRRAGVGSVAIVCSRDLPQPLWQALNAGLAAEGVATSAVFEGEPTSLARACEILTALPRQTAVIMGVGGGRALDLAKSTAHLAGRPFWSVPTSLSHDGFCSPQASLILGDGRRQSLPTGMPAAVLIDTEVCRAAPRALWLSGVGDLLAKVTAVADWKLAFHSTGEAVNDLAALISQASVQQFIARPSHDATGLQLLGTALMLNGIAMAVAGSSRPASGAEHLISHALDAQGAPGRLHGWQVGVATYLTASWHDAFDASLARRDVRPRPADDASRADQVWGVLETVGFWSALRAAPFVADQWRSAVRAAPAVKPGYFTILSVCDGPARFEEALSGDVRLGGCFV